MNGVTCFFKAPVVSYDWRITRKDEDLVRFGYLWKLYDMVAEKGLQPKIPILDSSPLSLGVIWLKGGYDGNAFLVRAPDTSLGPGS